MRSGLMVSMVSLHTQKNVFFLEMMLQLYVFWLYVAVIGARDVASVHLIQLLRQFDLLETSSR